jgi:hypothetical protein
VIRADPSKLAKLLREEMIVLLRHELVLPDPDKSIGRRWCTSIRTRDGQVIISQRAVMGSWILKDEISKTLCKVLHEHQLLERVVLRHVSHDTEEDNSIFRWRLELYDEVVEDNGFPLSWLPKEANEEALYVKRLCAELTRRKINYRKAGPRRAKHVVICEKLTIPLRFIVYPAGIRARLTSSINPRLYSYQKVTVRGAITLFERIKNIFQGLERGLVPLHAGRELDLGGKDAAD